MTIDENLHLPLRRPACVPHGNAELDPIERGIVAAVAYRDLFRFPPTSDEIHRYLPFTACTHEQVRARLDRGRLVDRLLCTDGQYFALMGRSHYFGIRRSRNETSLRMLPQAQRLGRWVASLPFVKMIAISGSLAAGNADDSADIDLFIVIEGGHLWRTRLLLLALKRLDRRLGSGRLCPNSMRTTRALAFQWQRLYIAQELQQMIPIYGHDVYEDILYANQWTHDFLPNASGRRDDALSLDPCVPAVRGGLERLLGGALGNGIEAWWRERKVTQFSQPGHTLYDYTPFTSEEEGLNLDVANAVERHYLNCLSWAGISSERSTC